MSSERSRHRDDDRSNDRDRGTRDRGRDDDDRGRDRGRGRDDDDRGRNSGSSRSTYKYRERTAAALDRRAAMGNTDFDKIVIEGTKMWTPNDGSNTVRILPPTWEPKDADDVHFGIDIHVHYSIGPDRQSYLCAHKMKGERCPICEERTIALREGDAEFAKELDARRRVLVYIIDRDEEKEGLQVWAMPQTVDQDLAKISKDKRTGATLPIDHPDEGYDIEFDKEGSKKNTKYKGLMIARDSSPLGNDRWLEEAERNPLPGLLMFHSYEHIAKVFGGGAPRDSGKANDERAGNDRGGRDDGRRSDRDADGDGGRRRIRDDGGRDSGDRVRDRGDAGEGGRDGGRARRDLPTWAEIHEMRSTELDKFADKETPKLDPSRFKTDEDLADAICEELGITAQEAAPVDDGRRRLRDMRGDR